MRGESDRWPLVDTLARRLFVAEHGHTGMSWKQVFGHDDESSDWHRTARRVLEGWWDPSKPFVVLDLRNDEMWLTAAVEEET